MGKPNLVNELQISAEEDDVLTVLRKTKRLASKLNVNDISEWLQHEQEGYPDARTVPKYRKVSTTLAFNAANYIPAGFGMVMKGIQDMTFDPEVELGVPESISTVLTWINDSGDQQTLCSPVPEGTEISHRLRSMMDRRIANSVTFLFKLNMSQIKAIPDRIKDKVLDWALALERAGVHGDDMSFSANEKEIAQNVTFHISDCTIEQLSNSGKNQKRG